MKKIQLLLFGVFISVTSLSQTLKTKIAYVSFYSELEEVLAENYSVESELDTSNGKLLFSVPIQSFMFDNATMQKHFNDEDCMHSKVFPRATFYGTITNFSSINFKVDGTYKIKVSGDITLHGVTKQIETKAEIVVAGGKIAANANFKLDRFEYGVTGTDGAISQILELNVKANYE